LNRRPTVYEGIRALASQRTDAHPRGVDGGACASARSLAGSLDAPDGFARDFLDPILCALLTAQAAWMGTHDPAALRRELIALLAALG